MPVVGEENLTNDADYGLLGIRPEAIESVPLAVRDSLRMAAQDEVLSFLGKRAKRPVTTIDYGLKYAMMVRACNKALLHRGARPNGQDQQIASDAVKLNNEWLDKVRLGLVEPYFVDATPEKAEFGPLGGSSAKADDWIP